MQGSVSWQVTEVFKTMDSLGESKHAAKEEAREAGALSWHDMGQAIGVHSFSTFDDYRRYACDAFSYVKSEFGIKDITRLESAHINAWLQDKLLTGGRTGNGVERATFDTYESAMYKLGAALERYNEFKGLGREYKFNFKETLAAAVEKCGPRNKDSRAYRDVQSLTASITGKYNLMGSIITESGARISEVSRISGNQLRGIKADPHTGQNKGWVHVKGKGGKPREIGMSPATYARLEKAIADAGGIFSTNRGNYRDELKIAALRSGQKYEGPHGQRWSWAQARHQELQMTGLSYEASLSIISLQMGHARSDISCHYLR